MLFRRKWVVIILFGTDDDHDWAEYRRAFTRGGADRIAKRVMLEDVKGTYRLCHAVAYTEAARWDVDCVKAA